MWKKEVTTNLRIKAAEEFSEVFQELQDCISQILSYADEVRFTHDLIKDNVNRTEIEFQISYVVKELP
jgi:predicted RNA-binding protein with EMAP domain